jgi:hypothetical protein
MEAAKGHRLGRGAVRGKALFDDNAPLYEWFADGKVNGCWNAVDRHVEAGHGDVAVAIIHDSPLTGTNPQDHLQASCRTASPRSPGR